jgi:hypothetical protein
METSWSAITIAPIVISVLALIVSILSFAVSYLAYRRNVIRELPLVSAKLRMVPDQPGWLFVDLRLENRSAHGWICEEVRILNWFSRGLAEGHSHTMSPSGDVVIRSPLPLGISTKRVRLELEVMKAGQHRDSGEVTFLVFVPPSKWVGSLSMRAYLRSVEPIERRMEVPIVRRLPALPNIT